MQWTWLVSDASKVVILLVQGMCSHEHSFIPRGAKTLFLCCTACS